MNDTERERAMAESRLDGYAGMALMGLLARGCDEYNYKHDTIFSVANRAWKYAVEMERQRLGHLATSHVAEER